MARELFRFKLFGKLIVFEYVGTARPGEPGYYVVPPAVEKSERPTVQGLYAPIPVDMEPRASLPRKRITEPLVEGDVLAPVTAAPVVQKVYVPAKQNPFVSFLAIIGGLAVVAGVAVMVLSWVGANSLRPLPSNRLTSEPVRVDYLVKGTARSADLTYTNEDGNTEQRSVNLPWELRLDMASRDFVSVSAQNQGDGTITCQIMADLKVIEESTSEGEYKIASCSGSVP